MKLNQIGWGWCEATDIWDQSDVDLIVIYENIFFWTIGCREEV